MPNIEWFEIQREAQAIFERPLVLEDVPITQRWQLNYTVTERKHLLSRLLLHPDESYPLPKIIHEITIRDAVCMEAHYFNRSMSTIYYQQYLTEGMRSLWLRHVAVNYPVAEITTNNQIAQERVVS